MNLKKKNRYPISLITPSIPETTNEAIKDKTENINNIQPIICSLLLPFLSSLIAS